MVRLIGIYNHSWGLSIMSEMMLCAKIQLIIYLGYGGVSVSISFSRMYRRPRPPTEVSQNPINATGSVLPHFAITIRYAIVARSFLVI